MSFSEGLFDLLRGLMPGFLSAWVFYSLTTHRRPNQFDQVVQALIITIALQPIIYLAKWTLKGAGRYWSIGPWNDLSQLVVALISALLFGLLLSQLANKDLVHGFLRKLKFSVRSSYATDWCHVFETKNTWIILNLTDGRRIFGWPYLWPTDPKDGHFYVLEAEWILKNGSRQAMVQADGVLVDARNVDFVEFIKGG